MALNPIVYTEKSEDLIQVFVRPMAGHSADTWRSTVDAIAALVTCQALPYGRSHRAALLGRSVKLVAGERCQPALRARQERLDPTDPDSIRTTFLMTVENDRETAWRRVIPALIDPQRLTCVQEWVRSRSSLTQLVPDPSPPGTPTRKPPAPSPTLFD